MFAYCMNNPVMCTDQGGSAPAWWQWTISGLMLVSGAALIATGVGGVVGGALICAGANSIIGSYVSEASGGSSIAGWTGGMVTGAICGTGAGYAGVIYLKATASAGGSCVSNLIVSGAVSFGSGVLGSAAGQYLSATIDGTELKAKSVVCSSLATGAVNCYAGLGAGIGSAIQGMPLKSTTSQVLANSLNAIWSLASEAVCDLLGVMSNICS